MGERTRSTFHESKATSGFDKAMTDASEILAKNLQDARKHLTDKTELSGDDIKLGCVDTNALWSNVTLHEKLHKELDVGFINQYGIWNCVPADVSAENVIQAYDDFKEQWGIPMQVGEHGWVTGDKSGKIKQTNPDCNVDYATMDSAVLYYKTLHDLNEKRSTDDKVAMFAFQVQDQAYRNEGDWGILNEQFVMKPGYDKLSFSGGKAITLPALDGADSSDTSPDQCYSQPQCFIANEGKPLLCCEAAGGCCSGENNLDCCVASNSTKKDNSTTGDSDSGSSPSSKSSAASLSLSIVSSIVVATVACALGM